MQALTTSHSFTFLTSLGGLISFAHSQGTLNVCYKNKWRAVKVGSNPFPWRCEVIHLKFFEPTLAPLSVCFNLNKTFLSRRFRTMKRKRKSIITQLFHVFVMLFIHLLSKIIKNKVGSPLKFPRYCMERRYIGLTIPADTAPLYFT